MFLSVVFASGLSLGVPFTEGAVLQCGRKVPVWGTSEAGVSISVSFAGQEKKTTAASDGTWRVDLDPLAVCCDGRDLVVNSNTPSNSNNQTILHDILVGEVWLVCGQSNMDVPLVGSNPRYRDGQGVTMAAVTRLPMVRWNMWIGNRKGWYRFVPEMLSQDRAISAVGFYFARELHQATGLPIGLVCAHCGGTNIEEWTPRPGYEKTGHFPELLNWKRIPEKEFTTNHWYGAINHWSKQPFMAYESRLKSRAPYAVRGMIWYQGEQNAAHDRQTYDKKLEALLTGLEAEFENPGLKFYLVQIPRPCSNPEFQEAQARFVKAHAADGRVKMAVISDVANVHEVHPAEKEPVGRRLAQLALRYDYGFDALEAESPTPVSARASSNRVTVAFAHANRLTVYNRLQSLESRFELAGADGVFRPATIVNPVETNGACLGELKDAEVVLEATGVSEPQKVRYLYARPYDSNVFNESGLPLGAFSMDTKGYGQ